MVKIKGIVDNVPKKKMELIDKQIGELYKNSIINKEYLKFLTFNLQKYKKLYEENLVLDKSNASFEAGNAWGTKDTKSILHEKTEKILELEEQILNLKNQLSIQQEVSEENNKKVKHDFTPIKVELNTETKNLYEKINKLSNELSEKEKALLEKEDAHIKIEEELRQNIYKLEEKNSNEEVKKKNTDKTVELEAKNFQLENDLLEIKGVNKRMEQKIFFLEKERKHLEQEKKECGKIKEILDEITKKSKENHQIFKGEQYLMEEIKSVSDAFDKVTEMNAKLNQQISFLNRKNRDFEAKIVEGQTRARLTEKQHEKTQNMLKRIEDLKKEIEEIHTKNMQEFGGLEDQLKEITAKYQSVSKLLKITKKEINDIEKNKEEKAKIVYKQLDEINSLNSKIQEVEKRNLILQGTVDSYEKAFRDNTTSVDLQRKIDILNEYVYCGLCKSNIKSYVIDKCMHCFCQECLEHRLKTRSRNCPKCNQEYTKSNIKRIYF